MIVKEIELDSQSGTRRNLKTGYCAIFRAVHLGNKV